MTELSENDVCNVVRDHLHRVNAHVLQLVAPGGQAPLSITYKVEGRARTIFPDVLAIVSDEIIVGELKSKQSVEDHAKLLLLMRHGAAETIALVERKTRYRLTTLRPILCHAQRDPRQLEETAQWVAHDGRIEIVAPI